jgi:hypothetical protein
MGMSLAIAAGDGFLHWRRSEGPRKVLFIDGEMPKRLLKRRLEDAVHRHGSAPDTFFVLSRDDFPDDMPPLNTEAGQKFVDRFIEAIAGVDFIIFDNIQALLSGDMKDETPWQDTLPWVRDLTRRNIGQIWIHHTGHDETHSYGTKTREWQLDTVILLIAVEQHPTAAVAFNLTFTKARERTPDNRADYEPATITLANDQWTSSRGAHTPIRKRTGQDRAFELLKEAIAAAGEIPPRSKQIPPDIHCVDESLWRRYCRLGCLSEPGDDPLKKAEAEGRAFRRAAGKLIGTKVGKWENWVWINP